MNIKILNFGNFFLFKSVIELEKYICINNYFFNIKNSNQLFYNLIYILKLVEIKSFKTYIRTNLANNQPCSFEINL